MAKILRNIACIALVSSLIFYNKELIPGISSASSTLKDGYALVTGATHIASSNPLIDKLQEQEIKRSKEILERAKNIGKDYDHYKCVQSFASNEADARKFAQQTGRPYNLDVTSDEACAG